MGTENVNELTPFGADHEFATTSDEPTKPIGLGGEASHLYLSQYCKLYSECGDFIKPIRNEIGWTAYAVTFKPYKICENEFTYSKGMDLFTKWAKLRGAKVFISTLEEMNCNKVHIHALVYLPFDGDNARYHDRGYANRYWVYCKPVEFFNNYLAYILAEAKDRYFRLGSDYRKYYACEKPQKKQSRTIRRKTGVKTEVLE